MGQLIDHGRAATREERIPFRVHPMLATLVHEPFHRDGWVYEEKYDGDRILAHKEGTRVRSYPETIGIGLDHFGK